MMFMSLPLPALRLPFPPPKVSLALSTTLSLTPLAFSETNAFTGESPWRYA
ncbi:hypothetical protein SHIRM173S_13351 [Streptomyces hirsutus]